MTNEELGAFAERVDQSPEDVGAWAHRGDCGVVSSTVLGHLNEQNLTPPMWSVGFVSVFAGVALAAELLKEAAGHTAAGSGAKFQFMKPQATGNGRRREVHAERACAVCSDDIHLRIWTRRWREAQSDAPTPERDG